MAQRRGQYHARHREEVANGAVDSPLTPAADGRGIVTIYTTLDVEATPSVELKENHKTIEKQAAELPSSSATLPDAIQASTAITSMESGALVAATDAPTSSTPASPTTSSASAAADATTPGSASASASASSTSAASSSSSSNRGSDDVATKAGIALGVLGGLLVVLALAYFMIVKRRKQLEGQQRRAADDEKVNGPFKDGPAPATPAKPPRLSLRPMTGLFTGFTAPGQAEQRAKSPANALAMGASHSTKPAPGASAWERPRTSESQSDHNPFGSGAEKIVDNRGTPKNLMSPMTPISETSTHMPSPKHAAGLGLAPAPRAVSVVTTDTANAPRISAITMDSVTVPPIYTSNLPISPVESVEVSPIESTNDVPVGQAISSPEATPAAAFRSHPVATGAAAGATLTLIERQPSERRQSVRKDNVPAPLDLTLPPKFDAVPPSPAGTEFSFQEVDPEQSPIASTSAAAIAAAGGPANSTVHRVQLDFNPTLDDEMGLQSGQLVRLLHEYDDGWALCIRLDRSQQGVVPRTCLSTRPVKPRTPAAGPRGPPVNPQGRARGPSVSSQRGPGGQPHSLGLSGQRGPGPGARPMGSGMGPGPRPQSPNGPTNRKPSPPGPSNRKQEYRPNLDSQSQPSVARKPAPGQAY